MDTVRRSGTQPGITTVAAGTGPFAAARPREEPPALRAGTAAALLFGAEAGWLCYTEMPDDGDAD